MSVKNNVNVRSVVHTVPMFRYAILVLIGVVMGEYCAWDAEWWLGILGVLVVGAAVCDRRNPMMSSVMVLAGVVAVGGFRISYSKDSEYKIEAVKSGVECKMAVITEPISRGKVLHFDGLVYESKEEKKLEGTKVRVSLLRDTITGKYQTIQIGDGIEGKVDVMPLTNWHRQNAHFDYVRWLHTRGFYSKVFVPIYKWEKTRVGWRDIGVVEMIKTKLLAYRQKILIQIAATGIDKTAFSVATAMALGNKAALTPEIHEEYSISGAAHILALSGVHLSIIYMMLTLILGRRRWWSSVLKLLMVWGYVLFAGMPISVVRAALMLTIWELTDMAGGEQRVLNVFGMTAFVMVMLNPQCVWDVGFEMSFAAVLAIISLGEPLREMIPKKWKRRNKKEQAMQPKTEKQLHWVLRYGWMTVVMSVAAQVGTMPLTAYYFGRVSVYFVLTNLVVMSLVTVIVWVTMIMAGIVAIDLMAGVQGGMVSYGLSKMLGWFAGGMNGILEWIAGLPGASIEGLDLSVVQVVAMYGIIITGVLFVNRKKII